MFRKGLSPSAASEVIASDAIVLINDQVQVDFLPLLKSVVRKLSILVTPIEVVTDSEGQSTTWFTFQVQGYVPPTVCIIGDKCQSPAEAKEDVAKKAIASMMPLYKFRVEDVSYHALQFCTYKYKLEKESYLTIRERVFGIKDQQLPRPYIVEKDQLTPRGVNYRIAERNEPPAAPKKRKAGENSRSFANVVPQCVVPKELETIFKRKKME